jgi:acyl-CoA thioester hydrolase
MRIEPQWIDYNDHLNMAYYNVLFDRASEGAVELLGLGEAYRRAADRTLVNAEAHVTYLRELKPDAVVRATFQLLDADAKRMHVYQELYHRDGWLAATSENVYLHVDLRGPKVVAFPAEIGEAVQAMLREHQVLPRSKYVGRVMGLRRGSKVAALRETLDASIAAGGDVGDDELDAVLDAEAKKLAEEGLPSGG